MSILGQSAAFLSTVNAVYGVICIIVALGVSLSLAVTLHVFRARAVVGLERLSPDQPAFRLIVALAMGLCSWLLVQGLYVNWKGIGAAPPGSDIKRAFTPGDWAFLATVPQVACFVTLWFADWAIGGLDLIHRLGVSLRRLPKGLAKGLLAGIVILPPTYLLTYLAEWFYNRVQFRHPHEHELLKVMREPQKPTLHWILILAAVFVAPMFEEFVFRGHVQTLIQRMLVVLNRRRIEAPIPHRVPDAGSPVSPLLDPAAVSPLPIISYAPPALNPAVWQTWGAIVLTSLMFAGVHEAWMRPPIFFLSLGLGYCYERTGNLWTAITVHFLFNSISTIVFLTMT